MDFLSQLQRKINDYFQPKLVSPLPETNILSEGQAYGLANDQSREIAAHQRNLEKMGRPTPTPVSFNYSNELANVPRKQTVSAKNNYVPQPTMKPVLNMGKAKFFEPAPAPKTYKKEDIMSEIKKIWPKDQWENAIKVFTGESGLRANAENRNTNGTRDIGVAQINEIHAPSIKKQFGWNYDDLKDPSKNLRAAKWIYDRNKGWNPWVAAHKLGIAK